MRLISEFYPEKTTKLNIGEFCLIETEKKIYEKVNKMLDNNEYNEDINIKIRLLILDFNYSIRFKNLLYK